jgi:hypothetical protein
MDLGRVSEWSLEFDDTFNSKVVQDFAPEPLGACFRPSYWR